MNTSRNAIFLFAVSLGFVVNVALVLRFGYRFGMGQGRHLFPLLLPIGLLLGQWVRSLKLKRLDVATAGASIVYALTFAGFSLSRFPH